jgi:hypothetical protein
MILNIRLSSLISSSSSSSSSPFMILGKNNLQKKNFYWKFISKKKFKYS